jgi:hypothetical protein
VLFRSTTIKYNGSEAAPINAGRYGLTVEIAEGDNYLAGILELPDSLDILKAAVLADSLAYDAAPVLYNGAPHAVDVAAKPTVDGLGVITTIKYNGSEAAPVNAGRYGLTVEVAEGDNYLAGVVELPDTLVILKADVLADGLAYDVAPVPYNGAPHAVDVAAKPAIIGMGNVTAIKYNDSEAAPVNAGRYGLTVEIAEGDNYLAGVVELPDSIVVNKAALTAEHLTYTPRIVQHNGSTHEVNAMLTEPYTGLGAVTVKYNGNIGQPSDVGVYSITVSVGEGANFYATTEDIALGNFEISNKAPVTPVELDYVVAEVTYDGNPHPVSVTAKFTVIGIGDVTAVKYNGSEVAPVNAGRYSLTVEVAEGDGYFESVVELPDTLVILKATSDILLLDYEVGNPIAYDGAPHAVDVAAKPTVDGLGGISVKYNGSEAAPVNAGSYGLTVEVAEGNNYLAGILELPDTLVILKVAVPADSLTYDAAPVPYNGAPHAVEVVAKANVDGLGVISVKYNGSEAAPVNAGRYGLTVEVAEGSNYLAGVVELPDTLVILKAPVLVGSLAYDTTAVPYDGNSHAVAVIAKADVSGLGAISVKYSGSEAAPTEAGEYLVTVDVAEGDNYLAAVDLRLGTLIIIEAVSEKSPVTLAELDYAVADVTYDGGVHPVVVAAKPGVALGDITVLYNSNVSAPTNAGRYVLTVEVAEGNSYLAGILELPDTLVILKAASGISLLDYEVGDTALYDGAPHAVAVIAKADVSGLGAISVKYGGSEAAPTEAGEYLVTVDVAEGDNYLAALGLELGSFVIYAAPVEPPTAVESSSASTLSAYVAYGTLYLVGEVESVRIVSTSGSIALSARAAGGSAISVAHLPAGIYLVLLQGKSEARVVKLQIAS